MDGRIDINEITGPLRDAIARLSAELADFESQATAIEKTAQAEATQILRKGADDAAPFRQQAANKQAAINRLNTLIAREEQEAARATAETLTDGQLDTREVTP